MTKSDDRQAAITTFADQWRRSAQWGYSSWHLSPHRVTSPSPTVLRPAERQAEVPELPGPSAEAIEQGRLDAASHYALVAFPGPVGDLIAREIRAYLSFGFRFDAGGLIARLADQVLATELPADPGLSPAPPSTTARPDEE